MAKQQDSGKRTCSKCSADVVTNKGHHRRCSGAESLPIRPKHDLLPIDQRGKFT